MSKKHSEEKTEKNLEAIDEKLTLSEQFLEKNQKSILIGLGIVILFVGIFLAYHYLYQIPKNEKAQSAIYKGERFFQNGQDSLALFGNGNDYIGFEAIINQFGGTKTADLAQAYAGICYGRMGNNEKALEHLKKFKGNDLLITPAIEGAIGDVYMNMGNTKEAISHYMNAAQKANDEMLSPIYYKKVGFAYFNEKNFEKAIETFASLKDKYPNSPEAQEADKYTEAAKLQQGNAQK